MKETPLAPGERTRDVYEVLPGLPQPPPVPVPAVGDLRSLEQKGLRNTPASRRIVLAAMKMTGLARFQQQLPGDVTQRLRRTNNRLPGLFAPPQAATLAFQDDPRGLNQIERAAALVMGVYDLHRALYHGEFEPDRYKGQPLEMGQMPNFFGTSLVVDGHGARLFKTTHTGHFTVIAGGRYFILSIDVEAGPDYQAIFDALSAIVATVRKTRPPGEYVSPGPITAGKNRTQRRAFRAIRKIPTNVENLDLLQHSFFTLALDLDASPDSAAEAARLAHSQHYDNRWFHSSLQLVVFQNARAAAICNFTAYLDGNTMMRGGAEIYRRSLQFPAAEAAPGRGVGERRRVRELVWRVDSRWVERARRDYAPLIYEERATFQFPGLGRRAFEERGTNAILAFVLALQMTSRRLTGENPNIIQFLTMNKYQCMDLETAWVSTPEVKRFPEVMEDESTGREEKLALLHKAVETQRQAMRRSRQSLSLMRIFALYLDSIGIFRKIFVILIGLVAILILRILGHYRSPGARDILISHPVIFPEVLVLGRPGVRLPYVRLFGLHYQMFDDKTVVTFMPGLRWSISNERLAAELASDLQRVHALLEDA